MQHGQKHPLETRHVLHLNIAKFTQVIPIQKFLQIQYVVNHVIPYYVWNVSRPHVTHGLVT